uniref:Uncharacterized protein n=1 Tax=Cacopsylla melanoneura TaxID=428564 RepID=A0A8D8PZ80_9HEMI
MVSFRHRIPARDLSKESSSSSEDSLPGGSTGPGGGGMGGRKPLPPPSRKGKIKSSPQTQLLLGSKRGVKSSSGYSSHTEETTFSFSDRLQHPPPPSRFSDRSSISRGGELMSDSSDLTKRRPSRGSNRRDNTFQIDV